MVNDPLKDYLAHCYLYYTLSESAISDAEFDKLCQWIAKHWDEIESPYKDFVFTLECGEIEGINGSELCDKCPPEIQKYARHLLEVYEAAREIFLGY